MGWTRLVMPLTALVALALVATVPAAASGAGAGYSIEGLRVTPPVGAFGGMPVNSCDLTGFPDYPGCRTRTFTLTNVGSENIHFVAYGVSGVTDPLNAALVPLGPESCSNLPHLPTGSGWALEPGKSCQIAATMNATQPGINEAELQVHYPDFGSLIAVIPLFAVGT